MPLTEMQKKLALIYPARMSSSENRKTEGAADQSLTAGVNAVQPEGKEPKKPEKQSKLSKKRTAKVTDSSQNGSRKGKPCYKCKKQWKPGHKYSVEEEWKGEVFLIPP